MRCLACILVVWTHSVLPNDPSQGKWLGMMSFMCSPSSELFLALSGAVLLPTKVAPKDFIKRRFLKLLPPLVVWSVVFVMLSLAYGRITGAEALQMIAFLPFKQVTGVYWFLYVMVGLYLFAPIISCWLRQASRRQVEGYLAVWLVTTIIPWLNYFFPDFYEQDGSYYWVLCYYGGFLGYWILGYYLKTYPISFKSARGIAVVAASTLYLGLVFFLKSRGIDDLNYTDNLQWGSVAMVALIFMVVKKLSDSSLGRHGINKVGVTMANYSFGVYLLHVMVLSFWVKPFMQEHRMMSHPVLEAFIIVTIGISICVAFIKLVGLYQPAGKWLFGLNYKKK